MNSIPNSRFIYVRTEQLPLIFKQNFIKYMAEFGVDQSRIEFKSVGSNNHMPEYNNIDIALDTFPRTGGTTTCEALWMGVPVVSLVGEAFYERLSFSNLSNVGLADLCAYSIQDYKDICLKLAADIERISYLRNNLRRIMQQSPLGDSDQFVKGFIKTIDDVI
jgi:predicted O-linked N-acetylglucosamine transferase (SPINDLY family)